MTTGRTYLDWNATAPLRADARASMLAALDVTGNPSSPHAEGRRARALIEDAREAVAGLVGARPDGVIFTSGATEANNTVLAADWEAILLSPTEHDSVLAPARACAARLVEVPVDRDGVVRSECLAPCLEKLAARASGARALLSLQIANNETGVLQPVSRLAAMARRHGLSVHSDAVQGVGRVPIDAGALGVDYLTLSAHKIGGPKGVGALVLRQGAPLRALLSGGGQERRRRAGTENVAAIAGFGTAARAAAAELEAIDRVRLLRDALEREVRALAPHAVILGCGADRLANTTCLALPGTRAETLVIALDLAGVAVSAGAACSSGKVGVSHVLGALGSSPEVAAAAIRVSLGAANSQHDIDRFIAAWAHAALKCGHRLVA